jgi:hypothetical protein
MSRSILISAPATLAPLMGLTDETAGQWKPEELAEILRHQLEAQLLFDLREVDATSGKTAIEREVDAGALHSFGDLFRHPKPPVELLRLTKEFAKSSDMRPASPLPSAVATLLYYAAVVAARIRCGERISQLTDDDLRQGVNWALEQAWIDSVMRKLFEEGRTFLSEMLGQQ